MAPFSAPDFARSAFEGPPALPSIAASCAATGLTAASAFASKSTRVAGAIVNEPVPSVIFAGRGTSANFGGGTGAETATGFASADGDSAAAGADDCTPGHGFAPAHATNAIAAKAAIA